MNMKGQVLVKTIIKDNDNDNYKLEAQAYVNGKDLLIYKDCMNTCSCEEYDRAWNNICGELSNQNDLPYNWYADKRVEEA